MIRTSPSILQVANRVAKALPGFVTEGGDQPDGRKSPRRALLVTESLREDSSPSSRPPPPEPSFFLSFWFSAFCFSSSSFSSSFPSIFSFLSSHSPFFFFFFLLSLAWQSQPRLPLLKPDQPPSCPRTSATYVGTIGTNPAPREPLGGRSSASYRKQKGPPRGGPATRRTRDSAPTPTPGEFPGRPVRRARPRPIIYTSKRMAALESKGSLPVFGAGLERFGTRGNDSSQDQPCPRRILGRGRRPYHLNYLYDFPQNDGSRPLSALRRREKQNAPKWGM